MASDDAQQLLEQAEQALVRERERSQALREVGLMLDSRMPRDVLLERVLSCAARVTHAERATLYLMDTRGEKLVSHVTEGGDAGRIEVRLGEGIAGTAASERRTVLAPDAYGDPRFARAWDERTGFRTRSVLAAPMSDSEGTLVGVVQVLNRKDGGSFDRDDSAMLEALAAQAAVAIEGARHIEALREKNQTLEQLGQQLAGTVRERGLRLSIEKILARADTVDEFLASALESLGGAVGARRAVLFLTDEGGTRLQAQASWGLEEGASVPSPERRAAVWTVLASGRPMACHGALSAEQVSSLPGAADSMLVLPLQGAVGIAGVVELCDRWEGTFGPAEVALAGRGCAGIATGLELLTARRERTQANRFAAVGRTLSTVLHDLRTPMTIISGYAQLMARMDNAEERALKARAIVRQFDNVQAMIGELLAFVRGDSGLLLHRVLVEQWFTEVVEVLRQELAPKNVEVSLDVQGFGPARFDTAKLTRVLHNLARNAAEALAPRGGGHVRILVNRDEGDLQVVCEDDGPGIPEGVRKRLFEAFVTEGKVGGTGLGLAIVKRIVDEHQGTLTVDTGSWGTRFTIRLPRMGPQSEHSLAAVS